MDKTHGSDAARRRFEDATTPDETEAVSVELIPMKGENLGDPVDYGAYLMGQLTGTQSDRLTRRRSLADEPPLPDFDLDSDRGYAYQCWDYVRTCRASPAHLIR